MGLKPNNCKPFAGLKRSAFELRAKDPDGIYRTIYVTFVKNTIFTLHCFQKKSNRTAKGDVNLANAGHEKATKMSPHQEFTIRVKAVRLSKQFRITNDILDLFDEIKNVSSSGDSIKIDVDDVA